MSCRRPAVGVEERNVTVSQRSKEYAHDYRYFPEPDLPPLAIDGPWVEEIRAKLPELAPQRKTRFSQQYGISEYDAKLLTGSKAVADYFERAVGQKKLSGEALNKFAKAISNWILGELSRLMNQENRDISEVKVTPAYLEELVDLVDSGAISATMAKTVLEESFYSGVSPSKIVEVKGYTQISEPAAVNPAVAEAIAANPKAVADYLGGKETATQFLVGQVMKIMRGQAKPELVNELVKQELEQLKAGADSETS